MMPILKRVPVIVSKPVANTIASTSYSCSLVRTPPGVIVAIGVRLMSIRVTLSRL